MKKEHAEPLPDHIREFNIRARAICERVDRVRVHEAKSSHPLSKELFDSFSDVPEVLVKWGEKALKNDQKRFGEYCIQIACENAHHDKKPGIIFTKSLKIIEKYNLSGITEEAYLRAIKLLPDDIQFPCQLSKYYNKRRESYKAISLLYPLIKSGKGDTMSKNILGSSYIWNEQPQETIDLLYPLIQEHKANNYTYNVFANACALVGNEKLFNEVKNKITSENGRGSRKELFEKKLSETLRKKSRSSWTPPEQDSGPT